MRKKILNHTCILVVVSVLLTFLAAGLVMYGDMILMVRQEQLMSMSVHYARSLAKQEI